MDEALVFYNPRKGSCPIYVQDDVSARLITPTKDYIKNFGGIVTDAPQKAIIVVIANSSTNLGSKLITDYAGEGSGKGVVDQAWVLESIRQGRMLGPPDWGGYVLHRHTVESFFELAENTPGIVSASSSVTVNTTGRRSKSAGQAPLPSPEPSGDNRSPARPSVPQALQRAVFSQQSSSRPTSSPHPRPSVPRPSQARNTPSVAKVISRIQGVRTKTAARHLPQVEARTTPQLPAAEDRMLMTKCGKFKFTEKEKAYVWAKFEQACATGPIVLAKVSANISQVMPWHSGVSVQNFIRRQQQYKEFVARRAGAGKGRSRQPIPSANNSKAKEKKSSPVLSEGRAQSPSKGSEDQTDSPSEPDSRSTSKPPAAPPMPKIPPNAVRFAYTEFEKEFIVEYLAWGERNDITPQSALYASIIELMPWRSEQSIRKFVSNHPELFGKRNIPPQSTRRPLRRAGLEYRLQQSQQKNPASPAEVRQSEDVESQNSITSAIGEGLASNPDDHRPQATTLSGKGKAPSILSEAVTEAMVLALKDHPESRWASDNSQKRARLWTDFAKTHPNHSAESYYQYHVEHHERLESAAKELTGDGGHTNGRKYSLIGSALEIAAEVPEGVAVPSRWPGPRIRNDLNPVIDSLIKEGKLEDPVIPPLSPSGSFYDQKDCLAVIQYLADNPGLFNGPIEVPRGASTKFALWGNFEARYKTRTAIAWAEFHRGHHSALEKAARKLISIRQEREHDDPWHESSSSSTVYGNADSQPSARGNSVLGFILQIPNLLKRGIQDDAESSGPSKRVKFEDS